MPMKILPFRHLFVLFLIVPGAEAAVSESDAARLGQELTPLGGQVAANADGAIPAWSGGITTPPAGYKTGDHHPDPFAADQPIYTVSAANAAQHEGRLT